MQLDQDLSGSDVKVVLYSVVSVATGIDDTARVLFRAPKIIAFGDDMTAADFTAWILSLPSTTREVFETACVVCNPCDDLLFTARPFACQHDDEGAKAAEKKVVEDAKCHPHFSILCDPKWHRVAFQIMGRFAVADINWQEMQALALGAIARKMIPCPPDQVVKNLPDPPAGPAGGGSSDRVASKKKP